LPKYTVITYTAHVVFLTILERSAVMYLISRTVQSYEAT